ncbi:hypothetical protein [Porphyromonas endodontalis]|uniref:hypothetical protein n=1 Tax=Porphyromonas endodontalis TaxID=28124 RepID=UPI003FA173E6
MNKAKYTLRHPSFFTKRTPKEAFRMLPEKKNFLALQQKNSWAKEKTFPGSFRVQIQLISPCPTALNILFPWDSP